MLSQSIEDASPSLVNSSSSAINSFILFPSPLHTKALPGIPPASSFFHFSKSSGKLPQKKFTLNRRKLLFYVNPPADRIDSYGKPASISLSAYVKAYGKSAAGSFSASYGIKKKEGKAGVGLCFGIKRNYENISRRKGIEQRAVPVKKGRSSCADG